MTAAPILRTVTPAPGLLTLSGDGCALDAGTVTVQPTNPAAPLPRLLSLTAWTEGETPTPHAFTVDRISREGRAALCALNLARLSVAEVQRLSMEGPRMVLCYDVAGEPVEWVIHGPVAHMVAGRADGRLWLRVFYLDTLDSPSGPAMTPPCADFLVTPEQWQELMPVLAGL